MFLRNYDNFLLHIMGASAKEYVTGTSSGKITTTGGYDMSSTYISSAGSTDNLGDGYINFKATNAALKNPSGAVSGSSANYRVMCPTGMAVGSICFGDGNTTVTYEDYKLSGNVVVQNSKLVLVSTDVTFNSAKKSFKRTTVYTYTNTGSNDITIKEWGLYNNTGSSSSGGILSNYSNSSDYMVLMYREVLDTPITIAAGTTATLTFSIDLPMFHHP